MNRLMETGPLAVLARLWKDLTPAQRVVVLSFAAVSVLGIALIVSYAAKPKMEILFSGLAPADAAAITQKLQDEKTEYELGGNGSSVLVPANKVLELRNRMSQEGLPQGGTIGFEAFDKQSSFGMTEFGEQIKYLRALQGDLTRTICALEPVESARVNVVLPKDNVFESEQEPTTASVVLKLRRGMVLADEQTTGLVHLVSSAVEGLKPENVTILDTTMNVLNEGKQGSGGGLTTVSKSRMKKQYETELAKSIQTMLAKSVGADKVVVRVNAEMSFDQKQIEEQKYDPASGADAGGMRGIITKEQTGTEVYNGNVTPPPGIPIGNPSARSAGGSAGASSTTATASGDNYNKSDKTIEYQVSNRVEKTVTVPGTVTRLSVAVLVDDKVEAAILPKLKEAASAAAGIDIEKGDQISVQQVKFDTTAQAAIDKEMKVASQSELYLTLAKNAAAVFVVVAFLVFLRIILKQINIQFPSPPLQPVPEVGSMGDSGIARNPADLIRKATEQVYAQSEPETEQYSTAPAPEKLPPEIVHSSPEDLAKLVRQWMSD